MHIIRKITTTFTLIVGCMTLAAQPAMQDDLAETLQTDALQTEELQTAPDTVKGPPAYEAAFEELMQNMYISRMLGEDCKRKDKEPPTYPDSIYVSRLQKLPYRIPMPYNSIVRSFIDMYARRVTMVEYMLGLGENYYFPIFEQSLAKYDLPLELKYLPVIESALNARAVSSAGAGGLWQFMVATGRIYNLEVNSLVDERCDPFKASDAAARFLRDLYNIYGDWHLVIASYNCGPGNVAKAIRKAGGKRDYWSIYPYLPRETRGYVPIFIAANYIMNYYKEHNICPARPTISPAVDTLMVKDRVHLEQIATVLDVPLEQLRFMNPQYKRDIIPGNIKAYPLVLPVSMITDYQMNRDTILQYRAAELVMQQARVEPSGHSASSASSPSGKRVVYYTVRSGDNLGKVAARYGTTINKIKQWNGIKGTTIRIGQRLKIYR